MRGLARAEWLRFRKRGFFQLVVVAVPLLAGFIYFAGWVSLTDYWPTFDADETRARIVSDGSVSGVPPEELDAVLDDLVEQERLGFERYHEELTISRAKFAFPQSLATVLGNGWILFFALILLTSMSIGDEFGWGTIRTALLAASHRRRMLMVRLLSLALVGILMLAATLVLGAILPLILAIAGAPLPGASAIDVGGLAALLLGQLLVAITVIAFAALVTLHIRSGSLTVVVVLVYVLVETAVIGFLSQMESFQYQGANEWLLDAFPFRGHMTLISVTSNAAGGPPTYVGDGIVRDLSAARVPLVAMLLVTGLFLALSFRRFSRMDIVE